MKAKYILGLALASMMATTSCSDFLEEDPKGQLTATSFGTTQDDVNMSNVALYKIARDVVGSNEGTIRAVTGDDITTAPSDKGEQMQYECLRVESGLKHNKNFWNNNYKLIKAANGVLKLEETIKASVSTYEAGVALGMAHFFRAYAYFNLVRSYGPLPMNLTNEDDNNETALTPTAGVYTQILSDLEAAEGMLPQNYKGDTSAQSSLRRPGDADEFPNKPASQATRAAEYMAMAGWPLNKGTEYYSKAKEECKKVISAGYELVPEYKQIYAMGKNHFYNKEVVWGLASSAILNWAANSAWSSTQMFNSAGGWGDFWGALTWWKEYPEGTRKDAIYAPKVNIGGNLINWWETAEKHPMFSVYLQNKVGGQVVEAPFDYTLPYSNDHISSFRHPQIRLAEVLCWYAECCGRTNTDIADGLAKLNQVRSRAGAATLAAGNGTELADLALQEHGWEITGYITGLVNRRDDLFRMGPSMMKAKIFDALKVDQTISTPGSNMTEEAKIDASRTWSDDFMYYP